MCFCLTFPDHQRLRAVCDCWCTAAAGRDYFSVVDAGGSSSVARETTKSGTQLETCSQRLNSQLEV